jgi:hypothetical protein
MSRFGQLHEDTIMQTYLSFKIMEHINLTPDIYLYDKYLFL